MPLQSHHFGQECARMRNNIVFIGFMGSGKTSVGRLVAQRLGFQFVDTDAVVVERTKMLLGRFCGFSAMAVPD